MMRLALSLGAVLAGAACHASYPSALADCANVVVQPANQGESGCAIQFSGCPENGSAQIVCDGKSTCTCSWTSDFARGTAKSAHAPASLCSSSADGIKGEATTADVCGGGG